MKRADLVVASVTVWLLTGPSVLGQTDPNRMSVALSDPSRPGTVRVNLFLGAITVRASDTKEVVVVTSREGLRSREQPPEASGLKRLTPPSGLSVEEENNVVSIAAGRLSGLDMEIQVPARTNLAVRTMNGQVLVEQVEGDIEATSMNGSITLTSVRGAVVAHAMNGQVAAVLTQVTPQKPMSFTSLNGTVDVTLPPSVAANLKLRSDRGDVYTDFDVQVQPPAANPPVPDTSGKKEQSRTKVVGQLDPTIQGSLKFFAGRVDTTIQGSVNGGGPEFDLRTFNGNIYLRKGT